MKRSPRTATLDDLKLDPRNANRGTPRGAGAVEDSLREFGAGRSLLVDKHGVTIAGNKTLEAAKRLGLSEVVVVETDGQQLVVVKRKDLDIARDPKAKALAVADNRASEVGLEWDTEVLAALIDEGVDLTGAGFTPDELDELTGDPTVSRVTPIDIERPSEVVWVLCAIPVEDWPMHQDDVERLQSGSALSVMVTRPKGDSPDARGTQDR